MCRRTLSSAKRYSYPHKQSELLFRNAEMFPCEPNFVWYTYASSNPHVSFTFYLLSLLDSKDRIHSGMLPERRSNEVFPYIRTLVKNSSIYQPRESLLPVVVVLAEVRHTYQWC